MALLVWNLRYFLEPSRSRPSLNITDVSHAFGRVTCSSCVTLKECSQMPCWTIFGNCMTFFWTVQPFSLHSFFGLTLRYQWLSKMSIIHKLPPPLPRIQDLLGGCGFPLPPQTVEQKKRSTTSFTGGLSTKKGLQPLLADFRPSLPRNPPPERFRKVFRASKQLTRSAFTLFRHPTSI